MVVLRGLTVLGLLASAWIHLDFWLKGYRDIEIIGPLFLVNVVAGVLIAVGVLFSRHWLPPLGSILFGAGTLGAFLLSGTVGLFGIDEQTWGPPQIAAAVAEVVCVLGGAALLDRRSRGRGGDSAAARSDDPTDGITDEFGPRATDGIARRVAEEYAHRADGGPQTQVGEFGARTREEIAPRTTDDLGRRATEGITRRSPTANRPRRRR